MKITRNLVNLESPHLLISKLQVEKFMQGRDISDETKNIWRSAEEAPK